MSNNDGGGRVWVAKGTRGQGLGPRIVPTDK